ncbi:metalloregulator ArsR/SmtB family transcription factor [Vibrio hannami]|uniref:ArsR/SmtB family transcription factor n=1 Tax=Vibrio hannami TaxID=2717094 RepID=UPI00240E9CA4|nr:metalloregulator ArsR/SmtB family transcription factor [Vibrio hannami]MDG3085436.1 metalloregulator ArsR/SmtB family transcription factor [Vibrio hannami]
MDIEKMQINAEEVSDLLKTMAHPDRLLVLCQLTKGEVGAGKLQACSSLSQSAFSQHLTVLKKHKLVSVRKESQQVFYSLADHRVSDLIKSLHTIYCN